MAVNLPPPKWNKKCATLTNKWNLKSRFGRLNNPLTTAPIQSWNKTYGGTYTDYGMSVQTTNDNGYIIAGQKSITGNNTDFWVLKTDEQGNT